MNDSFQLNFVFVFRQWTIPAQAKSASWSTCFPWSAFRSSSTSRNSSRPKSASTRTSWTRPRSSFRPSTSLLWGKIRTTQSTITTGHGWRSLESFHSLCWSISTRKSTMIYRSVLHCFVWSITAILNLGYASCLQWVCDFLYQLRISQFWSCLSLKWK